MSQEEVIEALENQENGLSADELAGIIEINATAVRNCLNRLLKRHEVKRITLTKFQIESMGKKNTRKQYRWILEDES